MSQALFSFLQNSPGAPFYIKTNLFIDYLKNTDAVQCEALRFFYEGVAINGDYQELIKRYRPHIEEQKLYEKQTNSISVFSSEVRDDRICTIQAGLIDEKRRS
jgi:hypothetical protein